jgi:flagellar assembly factor FliW
MRKADTLRFGPIEVEDEKVIHFSEGIPAFEQEHEFVIIPYDEESPYVFLQSLQTPDLAFLMTMPFIFFPDYEFELDDENQQKLGLERQEDMLLYVLLTIPQGRVQDMTANLMAPLVINAANQQARQLVLEHSPYQTKHRLFPTDKAKED